MSKDSKGKFYKRRNIINNIQVPGMALLSNAGLPLYFSLIYIYNTRGGT
jgi:hypothetical protein